MAKDCLAAPGTTATESIPTGPAASKPKTCYKCQQEGHVGASTPKLRTLLNSYFIRSPETAPRTLSSSGKIA
ncbi:hypothetical protein P691DRAFT_807037 [Macrolepiota fuliginosa MF-IS2]|uniref:CCHC-type domain-containing protein n=1 Tax=Macrolepiota fuliginosa MF-IS2 TaxID=1400762 RepID=A0A9P6C4U7_9AGAR|nr:hypothetical protein P691DRAFT_807037 [Macrolepiota fuliginosa MF-IS2]